MIGTPSGTLGVPGVVEFDIAKDRTAKSYRILEGISEILLGVCEKGAAGDGN